MRKKIERRKKGIFERKIKKDEIGILRVRNGDMEKIENVGNVDEKEFEDSI